MRLSLTLLIVLAAAVSGASQTTAPAGRTAGFDQALDLYVRDGLVYYRALKSDRGRIDAYVTSLASVSIENEPRDEQVAFWLNAYNAIVLKTVIDRYPIGQPSREYPAGSVRQISGAFERAVHRLAGRPLTLDQIEQTVLPAYNDPRVFLALGRGAIGSGRLRSEAYTAAKLETQLADAAAECVSRSQCVQVDRDGNRVRVSSIFSWRQKEFTAAYSEKADKVFGTRSPIERAVLAFVAPRLLTTEREFLETNTFKVEFLPFDWHLNDLTGRGGR